LFGIISPPMPASVHCRDL